MASGQGGVGDGGGMAGVFAGIGRFGVWRLGLLRKEASLGVLSLRLSGQDTGKGGQSKTCSGWLTCLASH